ncbi:tRNA/rRNA methyltransferase YsgA [Trypanosoma theileri]|uniref:tRNA/rRNA methyltransferase YsgA n=1 Tax=Trypanosoma theileri TaxID=67003 RepID=A0A1X0P5S3_9TRYP|nr:tRNA/rRNA methyltransferase YsgA [Trypanosoma theileri]ORC92181.1 tRNA/rRNA methyltransferase YsgA [Trypanosoma theileri]
MRRLQPSLLFLLSREEKKTTTIIVSTAAKDRVLSSQYRYQSTFGEQRTTARRSKQAYHHPLAPKDPAARNIVIPDAVHAKARSSDVLSPEVLQKRAQRALLMQLQQNIIWEGTVIDDERHDLIQHFTKLRQNYKYRSSKQMMIVSGKEILRELFEAGYTPRHLLVRDGQEIPSWTRKKSVKTEIVRVNRHIAEVCAPGNDGFIGDFDIPPPPPKENLIANKQRLDRVLVLDNVDDPGLLGTLLRTASGFQYDAIIATNHCADLYDHCVVRAARGAHFQHSVPIYTLRDEDGDNVYGMLNHIVQRNNLSTVCFTHMNDEIKEDSKKDEKNKYVGEISKLSQSLSSSPNRPVQQETLSDYCRRRFTDESVQGQMLIAGPNHKRNSVQRWSKRIASPLTQLLLDEVPQTDALVAFSVVLHALRPHGNWDYLPMQDSHKNNSNTSIELQTRKASVDIGADRLGMSEHDLNLDEEEQIEKANFANEFMRWRRLQRGKLSDYDRWMEAEMRRVKEMAANEQKKQASPWSQLHWREQKGAAGMPSSVPNIIDEYRMPLDRDALREEREISEKYVRPGNYDQRVSK